MKLRLIRFLFIALLVCLLMACPNPTNPDNQNGDLEPGEYVINNSSLSEDDSNDTTWQTNNWIKIEVPLNLTSSKDVKYKIELEVDPCAVAGTNPYFRFDDASFSLSGTGANLLQNPGFATNRYSDPMPASGDNQYNNWLPWNIQYTNRSSEWGAVFVSDGNDKGHSSPEDTTAIIGWTGGGNYTVVIEQTVSAVAPGSYILSGWILLGNVRATVRIKGIPQ